MVGFAGSAVNLFSVVYNLENAVAKLMQNAAGFATPTQVCKTQRMNFVQALNLSSY
jgi:hypothetical protein